MNKKRYSLFLVLFLLLSALALTACGASLTLPEITILTPGEELVVEGEAPAGTALAEVEALAETLAEAAAETTAAVEESVAADNTQAVYALEGLLADIYEDVNPSVVHIQHPAGEGSGFVWDTAGHIVTNDHVIAGAEQIFVTFADGSFVEAQRVGSDPDSDLAVLRVNPDEVDLRPVRVADSTQQRVGELVIAIGNPFGQEGTMTVGIISALGRQISAEQSVYRIPDVIQTDAAINPGNSGGVLLNTEGELVGVTSQIISAVRSSSGVGFAIPSTIVNRVVPALISDGFYAHPYLGVTGTTVTAEIAATRGLPAGQRGALLVSIVPGGPADQSGLFGADPGGDIVLAVDGNPVQTMDDLITYLARYGTVGEPLTFTVQRDGQTLDIQVTLGARPE